MNVEGTCPDCLEDEDFSDGKYLEKENAWRVVPSRRNLEAGRATSAPAGR
jgi:hypothetical protein